MNIQYDAIDYAQQLEAAGVSRAQAEVHARTLGHVLSNCVASPSELHDIKTELTSRIDEVEIGLRADISAAESRLRMGIHDSEARMNRRIDILEQKLKFQQWTNGLGVAMLVGLHVQAYLR